MDFEFEACRVHCIKSWYGNLLPLSRYLWNSMIELQRNECEQVLMCGTRCWFHWNEPVNSDRVTHFSLREEHDKFRLVWLVIYPTNIISCNLFTIRKWYFPSYHVSSWRRNRVCSPPCIDLLFYARWFFRVINVTKHFLAYFEEKLNNILNILFCLQSWVSCVLSSRRIDVDDNENKILSSPLVDTTTCTLKTLKIMKMLRFVVRHLISINSLFIFILSYQSTCKKPNQAYQKNGFVVFLSIWTLAKIWMFPMTLRRKKWKPDDGGGILSRVQQQVMHKTASMPTSLTFPMFFAKSNFHRFFFSLLSLRQCRRCKQNLHGTTRPSEGLPSSPKHQTENIGLF